MGLDKRPVIHRTKIESARIEDGALTIEGLMAAVETDVLEGMPLSAVGKTFEGRSFEQFPRPDIKERFPQHAWLQDQGVQIRGFQARFPLSQEEQRNLRLVALTPHFQRGEGAVILCLVNTALPLPSAEAIARIGDAGSDFQHVSLQFCGYCVQLAGLQPAETVLDVGCGVGRMAYTLAHYLMPSARYHGFDVEEKLIQWCQQTITPRFPHFLFRHLDLHNRLYNPAGGASAEDVVFPYEDGQFNFVFLASVFTHMRAREVRRYLDEIFRVLKPGGRCLATWFLLNREAEQLIQEGKSAWNLVHPLEEGFTANPDCPESCIGHEEAHVRQWLAERRFRVTGSYFGNWCGRSLLASTSHQDMLVFCK